MLASVSLLTNKPVIYAANMSEDDFKNGIENNKGFQEVKAIAQEEHAGVLPICAEIEAEIPIWKQMKKNCFCQIWA